MISFRALFLVLLLVAFATSGSSGPISSCEELCNASSSCTGTDSETCSSYCSQVAVVDHQSGCGGQLRRVLSCASDNAGDICSPSAAPCGAEARDWASCVRRYCERDSGNPHCEGF